MMKNILIKLILASIFISACGPNAEEMVPTIVAQTALANQQNTQAFQQSVRETMEAIEAAFTSTPTITFTPSPSPTSTETITPTPTPIAQVIVDKTNIRTGPGNGYNIIQEALLGEKFNLIGVSFDGKWFVIDLGQFEKGWIEAESVEILSLTEVPIVDAPPTPVKNIIVVTVVNQTNETIHFILYGNPFGGRDYNITVKSGESKTVQVEAGIYLLKYGASSEGCKKYDYLVFTSIYWAPPSAKNICATLP